jgi:hypothetical protein
VGVPWLNAAERKIKIDKEIVMKMSKMNIMCLLLVSAIVAVSCPGQAAAKYDTGPGNCLSLPVIWSEGVTKDLRGAYGTPLFAGETFTDVNGVVWYVQQDEENIWQAESADGSAAPVHVTSIDWGDNLEAHPWTIRSIVRTEAVLYQDISAAPMLGFEMAHLWGTGTSEMWGTNGIEYLSASATVYSGVARYTIQKLEVDPYDDVTGLPIDNAMLGLAWDAVEGQWTGPVGATLYNSAVWEAEGVDGKALASIYSAEINIPGKVIYGYNWNVRKMNDGLGYYRITFSMDAVGGKEVPIPCNTFFTEGVTSVKLSASVEGGGIGVIDFANNLTYIDVEIIPK